LGWYDYGFRWYDPVVARFVSVDPLAEQFYYLTTFQYASNDPIANIDLDGLEGTRFDVLRDGLSGDPGLNRVNATSAERKQVALDEGKAFAEGAAAVGSLIIPGPEDVVIGLFLATKVGQAFSRGAAALSRFGDDVLKLGKKLFSKGDEGVEVIDDASDLQERATGLHSLLDPVKQERTTTAITEAIDGNGNVVNIVSSSDKYLPGVIKRNLKANEQPTNLKIGKKDVPEGSRVHHAEQTGIQDARNQGMVPTRQGVTRTPCSDCKKVARENKVIQN